jgi:hypothetical protein
MHYFKRIAAALMIMVLALYCSACCGNSPKARQSEMLPHVNGKWVGRIEPISVYGARARTEVYQAYVLRIEKGPSLPHPVPIEIGAGKLPILTQHHKSLFRIFEPETVSVGELVEVEGLMVVCIIWNPHRSSTYGDVDLNRHYYEKKGGAEHTIVIKGKPKILKE